MLRMLPKSFVAYNWFPVTNCDFRSLKLMKTFSTVTTKYAN